MTAKLKLLLVFIPALVSARAWAWGDLGHSIVGAIAEQRMAPETKAFVEAILGIEPAAFSATWADAVRDDDRFNHDAGVYDQSKKNADDHNFSDYHFVDVPTGFTYDTRPNKDLKDAFGGISGALKILKDTDDRYPRVERIVALRYVIHLIGDIHQPLHVGNGYDIGANFCSVYWMDEKSPRNLHSVWDGSMVTALGATLVDPSNPKAKPVLYYPDFIAAFKKLRADQFNQAKPTDTSLTAIKAWINEAAAVRETTIYPDAAGSMNGVPATDKYKHRPYCLWFADKNKNIYGDTSPKSTKDIPASAIPRIDKAYVAQNIPVVEHQLLIAGIRLAAVLDDVAQEVAKSSRPTHTVPTTLEDSILKSLQDVFHNKDAKPL